MGTLIVLAIFFALAAPANSAPGEPIYPRDDDKVGAIFALVAVFIAFCAGTLV